MGNSNGTGISESVICEAEKRIGRVSIEGRYHRPPQKVSDDYDVERKALGSGYNGAVLLARGKVSKIKYAVKSFKLFGVTPDKKQELVNEATIFLGMDHPHVARLVDVYESEENLSLIMECMEGGELFDRVTEKKIFSESDAVSASHQMLLAVNYIHAEKIVHRDLKLENFLYERKDTDFLKLIDFGFSKIWDKNIKMELSCGTLSYVAPEVLQKSYTGKCDLWSLGVIVFILLVGYMPFGGSSERQQIANIRSGKFTYKKEKWDKVSVVAFDFVKKLIEVDPERRLSAAQAVEHPWIKKWQENASDKPHVGIDILDSLQGFAKESQFRRSCMHLMAWSLTQEERAEVRQAFLEMDVSNTGTITLSDLRTVLLQKFEVPPDETDKVFNALEQSGDGEVNYSEFLAAMVTSRIRLHEDLITATFKRFDTDSSGFITHSNLREVLGTNVDTDGIIKQLDKSNDGKISKDEFFAYLKSDPLTEEHAAHQDLTHRLIDAELEKGEEGTFQHGDNSPEVKMRKRDKLKEIWHKVIGDHGENVPTGSTKRD